MTDPRLTPVRWDPTASRRTRLRIRLVALVAIPLAVVYLVWVLQPGRVGNPVLYAVLVGAELFNLAQALGFWWTAWNDPADTGTPPVAGFEHPRAPAVDVLIPVYDEPVAVVAPTVAAAARLPGGDDVRVALLDDKGRPELQRLAASHGVAYHRRGVNTGAKAGNLNAALARTDAPYVLVLDCDHVPHVEILAATLVHFDDPRVAMVQSPQYYANAGRAECPNAVADAAWAQQALFFGIIARGKNGLGAMFCCGTNVVFRRQALDDVGRFPEESVTEDFELSVRLHEAGWRSVYVPVVLAQGLGPEDMSSYVSQQYRWARGCLSALSTVARARLPWRLKAQYLLSASYFLSGWTALVYMALPVIRILTGAQPLAQSSADQFLIHFAPYFAMALLAVAVAGGGTYTFAAFALGFASFFVHVHASISALLRRPGRFVVTPKKGASGVQVRPVLAPIAAIAVLSLTAICGLARDTTPATMNNVAFALLHICVLGAGIRPALVPARRQAVGTESDHRQAEAA